jgi:hypothetical protein
MYVAMTKLLFDYGKIWDIYEGNLQQAKDKLAELEVFCNHAPDFRGLGSWIFEQTIQFCLRKEIEARGIKAEFCEQIPLIRRAKAAEIVLASDLGETRGWFSLNATGLPSGSLRS